VRVRGRVCGIGPERHFGSMGEPGGRWKRERA
jgi:hypothetical protein